jgi:hypothetical protein
MSVEEGIRLSSTTSTPTIQTSSPDSTPVMPSACFPLSSAIWRMASWPALAAERPPSRRERRLAAPIAGSLGLLVLGFFGQLVFGFLGLLVFGFFGQLVLGFLVFGFFGQLVLGFPGLLVLGFLGQLVLRFLGQLVLVVPAGRTNSRFAAISLSS